LALFPSSPDPAALSHVPEARQPSSLREPALARDAGVERLLLGAPDQAGAVSSASVRVTLRWRLPSAFMTYTSVAS
jgi:hypothetical protein